MTYDCGRDAKNALSSGEKNTNSESSDMLTIEPVAGVDWLLPGRASR